MMPVAMSLAAKSMGMSMDDFQAKLEKGQIASEDFIIPFSNALREMVRETGALEAALNTVRTSRSRLTTTFKTLWEKGFLATSDGVKGFFNSLTVFLKENEKGFETLGAVVGGFFKGLSYFIAVLSPVFKIFTSALGAIRQEMSDAFDLSKASEDISAVAVVMRRLAGAVLIVVGHIVLLKETIDNFLKEHDPNGEGLHKFFLALGTLIGGWFVLKIAKAVKALLGLFRSAKKGISEVGDITRRSGGRITTGKGAAPVSLSTRILPWLKGATGVGALTYSSGLNVGEDAELARQQALLNERDALLGTLTPYPASDPISRRPPSITIENINPVIHTNSPNEMLQALTSDLKDELKVNLQ